MNLEETAQHFRSMGLVTTPLREKAPWLTCWNTRDYTEKEWDFWFTTERRIGLGLVLGERSHNIVCIDIDPRKNGHLWEKENLEVLNTAEIVEESGRGDGGRHYFFLNTESNFKSCELAEGVDFLSTGKQAVMAPTVHPDSGMPYTTTKGDWSMFSFILTALPESVCALLKEKEADKVRQSQQPFETGRDASEEDCAILMDMLSKLEPGNSTRHDKIGSWVTDAVATGMPKPDIVVYGESWLRSQGREPQPAEITNWIGHAEKGLASGESYISNNRLAPERFVGEGGFSAVPDEELKKFSSFDWEERLTFTRDQKDYGNTLANIQTILTFHSELAGKLAYNEMTHRPIKFLSGESLKEDTRLPWDSPAEAYGHRTAWEAKDTAQLHHWFSASKYQLEVSDGDCKKAVSNVAQMSIVHPIRDWLLDLEWDGKSRLEKWLPRVTGAKPSDYHCQVGHYLILSIVARILKPGTKWDNCIILEGPQGNGKSSLCNLIAGSDECFCDTPGDLKDTQKTIERTLGTLVVEFGEIERYFSKYSAATLKNWLAVRTDTARMAYGHEALRADRTFVAIGTTNKSDYLMDPSGERRYFPVKTGPHFFALEWFKENRDQLFAEARAIIKEKGIDASLYLPADFATKQKEEQTFRKVHDHWLEDVQDALADKDPGFVIGCPEILETVFFIPKDRQNPNDVGRIKNCLATLGYKEGRRKVKGKSVRVWIKPIYDVDPLAMDEE